MTNDTTKDKMRALHARLAPDLGEAAPEDILDAIWDDLTEEERVDTVGMDLTTVF